MHAPKHMTHPEPGLRPACGVQIKDTVTVTVTLIVTVTVTVTLIVTVNVMISSFALGFSQLATIAYNMA
jgi:hypothetical protein